MHEYSLSKNILEVVLNEIKKHKAKKVNRIKLKVGQFNLLTKESLQEAFNLAAENTQAKGAILEIEETPGMEIEIKEIEAE